MKTFNHDVHTTVTKTHRSELVLSDLPQDRIYGFVPNGHGQSIKITEQRTNILSDVLLHLENCHIMAPKNNKICKPFSLCAQLTLAIKPVFRMCTDNNSGRECPAGATGDFKSFF